MNKLLLTTAVALTLGACAQYKTSVTCSEDATSWDKVGEPIEFNEFCSEVAVPYEIIPVVHDKDSMNTATSISLGTVFNAVYNSLKDTTDSDDGVKVVTSTDTPTSTPEQPDNGSDNTSNDDGDTDGEDTGNDMDGGADDDDGTGADNDGDFDVGSGGDTDPVGRNNPGNDKPVGKAGEQDKDVGESGGSRGASTGKDE